MTYYVGSLVRLSATFKDIDGSETDPSTVVCRVKAPSGKVNRYTYSGGDITKDATGQYHIDVDINSYGTWWHRWEGTGAMQAAAEDSFNVAERKV